MQHVNGDEKQSEQELLSFGSEQGTKKSVNQADNNHHGYNGGYYTANNGQLRHNTDDEDAVFDLSLEDEVDGDILLDWEQYAKIRRMTCFGMDCSWINSLPCFNLIPPEKWYQLSRRQRRIVMGCGICTIALIILIIIIAISVALGTGGGGSSDTSTNSVQQGASTELQDTTIINITPSPTPPASRDLCTWDDYRLPSEEQWIRPENYKLDLTIPLEPPYNIIGKEQLLILVQYSTYCVVMHAANMNVTSVTSGDMQGSIRFLPDNGQMIVEFDEALEQGSQLLKFEFDYQLSSGLSGFYLSTQNDSQGQEQVVATTQFEAISARKAFPCMDEPAFKATFDVSLTTVADRTALFNTELESVEYSDNGVVHHYNITPPMSTYTAAFVVGDLQNISTTSQLMDGRVVPVKVYAVPAGSRLQSLNTALSFASDLLPKYELLLNDQYSLSKLDLAALPDFQFGAMENWGLITFRETDLLVNEQYGSISDFYIVGLVVAHEMAHLWFGDYVTMEFWGDLWLNEGFATYFENIGATMVYPDYPYLARFYSSINKVAMDIDQATSSSRALSLPDSEFDNEDQIESAFEPIVYQKGASILRMLHAYLKYPDSFSINDPSYYPPKDDIFFQTLSMYLDLHGDYVANSDELWQVFDEVAELPISSKMKTWTYEKGLPLISVRLDEQEQNLYIKQGNFSSELGVVDCSVPWWVPVTYVEYNLESYEQYMVELYDCDELRLGNFVDDMGGKFVKLNFGQFGYYRVQYDEGLWERLIEGVKTPESGGSNGTDSAVYVSDVDYSGLLDDSYNLASIGELNISVFFELLHSIPLRAEGAISVQEVPLSSWSIVRDHFEGLKQVLPQECVEDLSTVVSQHIVGEYLEIVQIPERNGVGFGFTPESDESPSWRILRRLVLGLGGEFGNEKIITQASNILQQAATSNNFFDDIHPDVRSIVYKLAVESGDQTQYDMIKERYINTEDVQDKQSALYALGAARNVSLLEQSLKFSLSNQVKSQDLRVLVRAVSRGSQEMIYSAWKYILQNFDQFKTKYGNDEAVSTRLAANLAAQLGKKFSTQQRLDEFDDFLLALYPQPPMFVSEARGQISSNIKLAQQINDDACNWLKNHLAD